MRRKSWAVLLFFLGLAFLMYPQFSHLFTNRKLAEDIAEFHQSVSAEPMGNMHLYNQQLLENKADINDAFTQEVVDANLFYASEDETPDASSDLLNQQHHPFYFVISIPKIDVKLPIYLGASHENLMRGAAQVEGSSLPTGGPDTHSVVAAHRGTLHHHMFLHLERLKIGDTFEITTPTEKLLYRVTGTETVYPNETESLQVQAGKDLVTLVTCLKFPFNDRRLLVHAERVQ